MSASDRMVPLDRVVEILERLGDDYFHAAIRAKPTNQPRSVRRTATVQHFGDGAHAAYLTAGRDLTVAINEIKRLP